MDEKELEKEIFHLRELIKRYEQELARARTVGEPLVLLQTAIHDLKEELELLKLRLPENAQKGLIDNYL